jgi:hypothetical protein
MPRAGQLLPGSWITTLFTVMIVPMARPTRSHSHHRRSYIVATRSTGVVPRSSPTPSAAMRAYVVHNPADSYLVVGRIRPGHAAYRWVRMRCPA